MRFINTDDTKSIQALRTKLYQRFTAPLDAMWEALYIASSQTLFIEKESQRIGYCCIDEAQSLTQIFLEDRYQYLMDQVIQSLIESGLITSAKLSSIEPVGFNACMSQAISTEPNTFCYQFAEAQKVDISPINMVLVGEEDINLVKTFFLDEIQFDDNFGYTENLVERKELFMLREEDEIMATGECRISDSQLAIADIGVIVSQAHQRKGLGASVLQQMVQNAKRANRKPVCSTTIDNIGSQKAIQKAGFYRSNIIYEIHFSDLKIKGK